MENNNSDSSDKADSTVTAVQTTIKQQHKQTLQTLVSVLYHTNQLYENGFYFAGTPSVNCSELLTCCLCE